MLRVTFLYLMSHFYAEYNYAECDYADSDCRSGECRYADCRGVGSPSLDDDTPKT